MEKPIDEYLREALLAFEGCGIKFDRVGPFRTMVCEGRVYYARVVGYASKKSVSITHDGRRLVIFSDKKWITVLTDEAGVSIIENHYGFDESAYPMLKFSWRVDGDLALVKVEFDFNDRIKFVRDSDGVFGRTDDCNENYLKLYGDRLPAKITEAAVIMGQTVRMHIDVQKELEKIMQDIEIEEFIKAVKENI